MEVLLLGTAAAEAWPCPFCDCAACAEARRRGGRDIRTRAGALIDGIVKIDYGPDTVMQMQQARRSLTRMTTLIYTHAHRDHFTPSELQYRGPSFITQSNPPLLHVYGNTEVMEILHKTIHHPSSLHLQFHAPLEPGLKVITHDGTEILPLAADHAPGALLLRLTRNGRSLFYGHDSGLYPAKTLHALAETPVDLALFDCTYGGAPTANQGHMGIEGVRQMAARLRDLGTLTERTLMIATHFSHNGLLNYDELVERFAPSEIRVAYDGMCLEL